MGSISMDYSEIVAVFDFAAIPVSYDPYEDYLFRVEILRRISSQEEFGLRVFRREVFRLKLPTEAEWQNKTVKFEDVTLDWKLIKAVSAEDAFSKIIEEINYAFPFLSEKGSIMPKYDEIVKIIDLEPFSIPETDSYYRFRIEIIKKNDIPSSFRARAYCFECFELQPCYPIIDGKPKYDRAAPAILVEDESPLFKDIEDETIEGVIQQVLQAVDKLKAGSMTDDLD